MQKNRYLSLTIGWKRSIPTKVIGQLEQLFCDNVALNTLTLIGKIASSKGILSVVKILTSTNIKHMNIQLLDFMHIKMKYAKKLCDTIREATNNANLDIVS